MNTEYLETLEDMRRMSLTLKNSFSKTETNKWTEETVASELVLQTAHLHYSILSKEYKNKIFPTNGTDNGLDDELSDVLFNALNLLSFLKMTIFDIKDDLAKVTLLQVPVEVRYVNLYIQTTNIWDYTSRVIGYKHLNTERELTIKQIKLALAAVINTVYIIGNENKIDIATAMSEMFADAESFLRNFDT